MATRYSIALGGNLRKYPQDVFWDSALVGQNEHVEYAAHLKRREFVLPFHHDNQGENMQMWYREKMLRGLEVGDELVVNFLAAGTDLKTLVFNNKAAVPGTKVEVLYEGSAASEPVNFTALQTAVAKAKDALATAQAKFAADQSEANKKSVEAERKKVQAAEKTLADASTTDIMTLTIDLAQAGFHKFKLDQFLQSNGYVVLRLKEGSLTGTCFSIMTELTHFNDQHGCSCRPEPCDSEFPEAGCQPIYSSFKY